MNQVILKKHAAKRISSGHLWIFSNEIEEKPHNAEPGEIVEVRSSTAESYGVAFYNPHSLIALRLLNSVEFGREELRKRIQEAYDYRKRIGALDNIYRLVFGESDYLPGLVIDAYEDYFAAQILSAGMQRMSKEIFDSLVEIFPSTKGIIEKNLSKLRELEGLEIGENLVYGEIPETFISSEQSIRLSISLAKGQKTGYFLDQKINRLSLRIISKGASVLDCFCNQGGFALNAAYGGAKNVDAVDVSEEALNKVRENAKLNGFDNIKAINEDVFDYLNDCINQGRKYDLIILDPPAFAKSKKTAPQAEKGYAKSNRLALKCLNRGGFLATSSCSQHVPEDKFYDIVTKEAAKQKIQLRLIYRGAQAPDHPILASMLETKYLKFYLFSAI